MCIHNIPAIDARANLGAPAFTKDGPHVGAVNRHLSGILEG